jgi:hypothetical protein
MLVTGNLSKSHLRLVFIDTQPWGAEPWTLQTEAAHMCLIWPGVTVITGSLLQNYCHSPWILCSGLAEGGQWSPGSFLSL